MVHAVKALTIVMMLAVMSNCKPYTPGQPYYILSLDGGGYNGLITAKFVDYMELLAYNIYEKDITCFKPRDEKRIQISEMFDMVAGSETGAIIATTLAVKNVNETTKEYKFPAKNFANVPLKWFEDNVDTLYKDRKMGGGTEFVLIVIFVIFICFFTEFISQKCF